MPATRSNPFKSIYQFCNQGNSKFKLENLPPFPRYIDIELTNHCNFKCLMCPTGTLTQKRPKGFMSDSTYYKVLNEIEPYKTPLRFIRWGEPLMHKKVVGFIQEAKNREILCHINTNGSLLTEELIDKFLEIRLDSIKFSFQGVDTKSYKEMRNIDFYDALLEKVKLFHSRRGDRDYPYIHVSTTITYETPEQVNEFKELFGKYTDLVTVGRTVLEHIDLDKIGLGEEDKTMLQHLKERESVVKEHSECPEVFDKLSINWDGSVSACCSDYDNKMIIGNLSDQTLKEIWQSEKFNHYRKLLADMQHNKIDLCKSCYDYHSLQTPGLQKT